MTHWGYARVSTPDQSLDMQRDALLEAGVPPENIVTEVASGADDDRAEFVALLGMLEEGDRLTAWKLDRLTRSVSGAAQLITDLDQRGVSLHLVTQGMDTGTPGGKAMAYMAAVFAQLERDTMSERTKAGLAAARQRGKQLGRPVKASHSQVRLTIDLAQGTLLGQEGQPMSTRQIARETGLSQSTVRRVLADPDGYLAATRRRQR